MVSAVDQTRSSAFSFGSMFSSSAASARSITECQLAIAGLLDRERYEANNGLLVHVDDIVDFPRRASARRPTACPR